MSITYNMHSLAFREYMYKLIDAYINDKWHSYHVGEKSQMLTELISTIIQKRANIDKKPDK